MTEVPATIQVPWPVGPTYEEWANATGVDAWVTYKLKSAAWFIDNLERTGDLAGYARYVGIEMALDGALAALCGAFDASVGGIIEAIEAYCAQDATPDHPRWQQHQYNWDRCRERFDHLASKDIRVDADSLISEIDAALQNIDGQPLGWLLELQRLRNASIHHNTLPRHIEVQVSGETAFEVAVGRRLRQDGTEDQPGRGENPVTYLRASLLHLRDLTQRMLGVVDILCPSGVPTFRPTQGVTVHVPPAAGTVHVPQPEVSGSHE